MNREYISRLTFIRLWTLAGVLLLGVVLSLAPGIAHAGEMELGDLVLDNLAGNVSVRFSVSMDSMKELEEELAAGSTVRLTCDGAVYRQRSMWADASITDGQWVSYLSKDVLANNYRVELPGGKDIEGRSLPDLLDRAWEGIALDLGPWSELTPGSDYRLELRLSMDRTEVPVWLRYMLFFWSFDVYPERTYQLDFSY